MGSSFEDLDVWKKSCRLSVRLYKLLRDCHDYGMKDQMLRSSISIPSNIAQGSAAELRTQIYISQEVNMFSDLDANELINELKSISKMLQSLHS